MTELAEAAAWLRNSRLIPLAATHANKVDECAWATDVPIKTNVLLAKNSIVPFSDPVGLSGVYMPASAPSDGDPTSRVSDPPSKPVTTPNDSTMRNCRGNVVPATTDQRTAQSSPGRSSEVPDRLSGRTPFASAPGEKQD